MDFNEETEYVDDSFEGDTLVLTSNIGGKKDRSFSRNYAWAKHAADRGKIKTIVVRVVANGENYRTIDAFRRAISKPHPATRVFVDGDVKHALSIVDELTKIVPSVEPEPEKPRRGRPPKAESVETVAEPEVVSVTAEQPAPTIIVESGESE